MSSTIDSKLDSHETFPTVLSMLLVEYLFHGTLHRSTAARYAVHVSTSAFRKRDETRLVELRQSAEIRKLSSIRCCSSSGYFKFLCLELSKC